MIDWGSVLKAAMVSLPSLGLTYWVYKVLTRMIDDLRANHESYKTESQLRYQALENKLKNVGKSRNIWSRRFFILSRHIERNSCKEDCPIKAEYHKMMSTKEEEDENESDII